MSSIFVGSILRQLAVQQWNGHVRKTLDFKLFFFNVKKTTSCPSLSWKGLVRDCGQHQDLMSELIPLVLGSQKLHEADLLSNCGPLSKFSFLIPGPQHKTFN